MAVARAVVGLLALMAVVRGVAGVDSSSSSTPADSNADAFDDGLGKRLVNVLQTNLQPGARRLVVMQGLNFQLFNVPLICEGKPAIVSHTPSFPNNQCWAATAPTIANNLSCTCLTYMGDENWEFKVKLNTRTAEEQMPLEQAEMGVIEIDSTMFYGVADTVKSVVFQGEGETPVSLTVVKSPVPADSALSTKFIYRGSTRFQTLFVRNINFVVADQAEIVEDFVPSTLQNLTMSSCNITSMSQDFMFTFSALESLDLSNNKMKALGQRRLTATECGTSCLYTSINISNNAFETFPSELLNLKYLKTLDLTGNKIKNLELDEDTYNALKTIADLRIDGLNYTGSCVNGTLQGLGSATVCVANATTEASPMPAPTEDESSSSSYLMYIVIGGCLVIAVLVFLLVKRNNCRSRDGENLDKEPLDAYFDNTLSYEDTHATISASLLNDPIIITNRLPYKDIRVANCISKGGFGLVYSGVYNRRRVAIKKIRPDRAGDIKQIESFLKEICLIATLNHPRIVEFIGVSWDTLRNLCAVTEFMERGDLREVLHGFKLRNTPLTWESHKTTISLHIAEGLTYLHSLSPKIVHRDLKSKNVLLNGEMVAKLSDFGISRERHIEETHMTAGIGTSFWIAPEVLLGKDYDERADIFSFGVVLSEIDTDDYPYWNASNPNVGNKAQENMILQMVASGAMRPSFSDTCPQAILELADLCLQVDPADRPTAAEVAYKLQQIVQFMNPSSSTGSGRRVV